MTKLAEQIAEINHEIEVGRSNHEHKVALDAYAAILNAGTPALEAIRRVMEQRMVLTAELSIEEDPGFAVPQRERRKIALGCLEELAAAWQESDYKVKQSGEFAKFSTAIKSYGASLALETDNMFRAWVEETDAQIAVPEGILDLQRKVPDLSDLADKYDQAYESFKAKSRRLPCVAEARDLLATRDSIETAKAGMIYDLPDPVKRFFDALQSASGTGGAPLKLLNDDVLNWLEQHGQTENYVIRRKGRSTW